MKRAADLLPLTYQHSYAAVLERHLPGLLTRLKAEIHADSPQATEAEIVTQIRGYLEPIVGAVYDRTQPALHASLRRFEAVISDFYRSFLDSEKRAEVSVPLVEQLPPLATFAFKADAGPFTLPVDGMVQTIGAKVAVVSMPAAYAAHPVLWGALTHEVGGHDVLHADRGLLPELKQRVTADLGSKLGALWAYWMDEAASDIYGLLNMGPSFAMNLASLLTTLVHQVTGNKEPLGRLGSDSYADGGSLDVHPTDILRLHVALGVVGSLNRLSVSSRRRYTNWITEMATECRGDAADIRFLRVNPDRTTTVLQKLPFEDMATAAREVGRLVATYQLKALGGKSIQDLETWDDADEHGAGAVAAALKGEGSAVALGDDAQLIAGATLALWQGAPYGTVTPMLAKALDASAAQDPVFGFRSRDTMFFRPELGRVRREDATRAASMIASLG